MKKIVLAALLGFFSASLWAVEGMWTLDNLPKAALKKEFGFTPDNAWVDKVMKSSVRLGAGCSGSFISADGLMMTNHHCARGCIQQLSSAEKDYIKDGFLAGERSEELKCPTMELNRLEKITDVTARMNKATAGRSGAKFATAQKAEKSRIESECAGGKDSLRCDVVELYQGGLYHLYRYTRFQDARLVFAPEQDIAFFGGDPDNFNFPRYNLDMALVRAYQDGKPVKLANYFPFSESGPKAGELTFITGHPGSTQRQLTVSQLERLRDLDLVSGLLRSSEQRGRITQYATESPEQARRSQSDLFSIENSIKSSWGKLQALLDPTVFKLKREQEAELRKYVAGKPALKPTAGAWDEIGRAQQVWREIENRYRQIEGGRAFSADYFGIARTLVRGAAERDKPDAERLREFTEARLPSLKQGLFSSAPIYPEYEQWQLAWSLTKMREALGADDALVKQILGRQSPEALAKQWVESTELGDVEVRRQLWEGGQDAVDQSDDPFIALAIALDPEARALRKRYEDEVDAVEKKAAEQIAKARFARYGTGLPPDATFSLRLSYGEVKGWEHKGQKVPPFTYLGDTYQRHTGAAPFALPQSWLDAQETLEPRIPFNFVSTNDIIGGNSGSPVINRKAEIVGLVFDGNIHSLGGAFWFDERLNRSVSVHSSAMLEALSKVYGADALVEEISAR